MRTLALVAVLLCRFASAEQTFGAEESLAHPIQIPAAVLSKLGVELDLMANGCGQPTLAEALEATEVNVGSTTPVLLIKPRQDAWCLCGAYLCPAWIFQISTRGPNRLWSTHGTASVSFLNTKDRGYRRIRSEGGTAGHGFLEVWAWDGKHYVRSSQKDWVAGQ